MSPDSIPQNESVYVDSVSVAVDSMQVKALPELVVSAQNAKAIKDGFAFTPTRKEKSMSFDATSLLKQMALPTLIIGADGLKAVNGLDISYFINSKPASADDCKSLLPEDVLKVEYLSNPSDPQYMGAKAVLNFVMKKYEYGGYSRLMPSQSFIVNKGSYPVYSKFNYKRIIFDINASVGYEKFTHISNNTQTLYQGLEIPGLSPGEDLYRLSKISGNNRSEEYGVSFRAQYDNNSKFYTSQFVNISWRREPTSTQSGFTQYRPEVFGPSNTSVTNSTKNNFYAYSGYYRYCPDKSNMFVAQTVFGYTQRQRVYGYNLDGTQPFSNANKDNIYSPYVKLYYQHNFEKSNSLTVEIQSSNFVYFTNFWGDVTGKNRQVARIGRETFLGRYNHRFGNSWSLQAWGGVEFNWSKVNSATRQNSWNPIGGLSFNGRISTKSLFDALIFFQTGSPGYSYQNNVSRQVNEVEWISGNPSLSIYKNIAGSVTYTQIFSNSFSGYVSFMGGKFFDYMNPGWTPSGEYMIKKYYSDADMSFCTASVGFPIKFFAGSVVINPSGNFDHRRTPGRTKQRILNTVGGSIDVSYTIGPVQLAAYYYTRTRRLEMEYKSYEPMQYGFNVKYSKGNFFALADFYCPFSNRKPMFYAINYPNYRENGSQYNGHNYTRCLTLKLGYTFKYGRKVTDYDEINVQIDRGASSLPTSLQVKTE